MKTKLFFLILFCTTLVQAQETFVAQIFVKNFNELSISNAEVQLYDLNGAFISKGVTDQDGQFMMTMKPGKYQIKLLLEGLIKKERTISVPILEGNEIYNKVRITVLYEERKQFTLENLLFENNSAVIDEKSYPILDKLVDFLKNEQDAKFEIAGHTDNVGEEGDNQFLSENRAKAVIDYAVAHGVNASQLVAKGYGESLPVADNATPEGRAQNRRTEVKRLE